MTRPLAVEQAAASYMDAMSHAAWDITGVNVTPLSQP